MTGSGWMALALLAVFLTPAATALCEEAFCISDERSGDHSSPCEAGTWHAPRYRYVNATTETAAGEVAVTSTFACESDGGYGEWFYGNTSSNLGERNDGFQTGYFYGDTYDAQECYTFARSNPVTILLLTFTPHVGTDDGCPDSRNYPSVVSHLP